MIVAAAVCPHPPALVPEVGVGLPEIEPTRDAVEAAVTALLAAAPKRIVLIGPDAVPVEADETAGGSFAGFGCDVTAGGAEHVLPAPYTVGAWLLDRAGWTGPRLYTSSTPNLGERDALLVLADSDTAAGVSAPTHGDPRAGALDGVIAAALAGGDAKVLADLDVTLAGEWDGTGVAPLKLLGDLVVAEQAKGASVAALLRCDETPFGVRYWVADWRLTR